MAREARDQVFISARLVGFVNACDSSTVWVIQNSLHLPHFGWWDTAGKTLQTGSHSECFGKPLLAGEKGRRDKF